MSESISLDRRQRRRLETIDEVLDIAVDLMTEQGAAGLSIGEVARRMGIRPPSLYVYFPSKNALYDALFARGAAEVLAAMKPVEERIASHLTLEAILLDWATTMVRWCVEHPAYTQLLFWRPVPGFEPSPSAYEPAVALVDLTRGRFTDLQQGGLIRGDVDITLVLRDWTILTAGVVSQQMSNAPDAGFERGHFTAALPTLVAMFAWHYGTPTTEKEKPRARRR
jgi:AcrR family transcriptional regulator